ncbi:DUF411 domain-containing protein [Campylobacter suis]|uniref:DUF411 domain-containing protein n=1 Tax=Campylobacter suis TaxID=2790657 RepID=A0ABN7K1A1_9BACT|nr:DUF411 domain-containing protein [Campylobacter suis]CAD7286341.1 hypothetical protein LMG8286_00172 [Campylobacter suis]
MKNFNKIIASVLLLSASCFAANLVEVYKSPSCGCCSKWEEKMREAGFETKTIMSDEQIKVKANFSVPLELTSCHTGVVEGYVVEGHVPPAEVKRLLELKPTGVVGISVPGMPLESPGMEQGSTPEQYDVVLFKKDGSYEIFATYIGSKKIK